MMEKLETVAYDNANKAQKADYAREASGQWEDDGYITEIRDVPYIMNADTANAYLDGGRFEIWGEEVSS